MAYAEYSDYASMYGDMEASRFDRLRFEASKAMDANTTGVDGVRKLRVAFPEDEAEAIRYCCCKLIRILDQIERTADAGAVTDRGDGTFASSIVTSVSSGSESMTFAQASASAVGNAAIDKGAKNALIMSTIREYLEGITDSNGVFLLYQGRYPNV